jgi:hypothetical protein
MIVNIIIEAALILKIFSYIWRASSALFDTSSMSGKEEKKYRNMARKMLTIMNQNNTMPINFIVSLIKSYIRYPFLLGVYIYYKGQKFYFFKLIVNTKL